MDEVEVVPHNVLQVHQSSNFVVVRQKVDLHH